ncbi:Protein of unknown function [Gryllus bimaculatus]|nr:Protein of unknown function [Gryllus bimaculatus]
MTLCTRHVDYRKLCTLWCGRRLPLQKRASREASHRDRSWTRTRRGGRRSELLAPYARCPSPSFYEWTNVLAKGTSSGGRGRSVGRSVGALLSQLLGVAALDGLEGRVAAGHVQRGLLRRRRAALGVRAARQADGRPPVLGRLLQDELLFQAGPPPLGRRAAHLRPAVHLRCLKPVSRAPIVIAVHCARQSFHTIYN